MPLSSAELEDNTIKLMASIFFYLLLTSFIYLASEACTCKSKKSFLNMQMIENEYYLQKDS